MTTLIEVTVLRTSEKRYYIDGKRVSRNTAMRVAALDDTVLEYRTA